MPGGGGGSTIWESPLSPLEVQYNHTLWMPATINTGYGHQGGGTMLHTDCHPINCPGPHCQPACVNYTRRVCCKTKRAPGLVGVAIISCRYVKNAMVCQDRLGTNKQTQQEDSPSKHWRSFHSPTYILYAMYTLMILCRMTGWNYMTADVPTALPLGCQRNCPYPPDPHRGP